MQRRDFIKNMFLFGAAACAGCSKHGNMLIENQETLMQVLAFPICYHCNLNCASCSHFAPLAPKYEMPPEIFERDIKQLYKITNGKVLEIRLLGGEPLLNNKIADIIDIAHREFPNTPKNIFTNGLILKDMPDNFWKTIKKTNTTVTISFYTKYPNFLKTIQYEKLTEKHGKYITVFKDKRDSFDLTRLDIKNTNPDNYFLCKKYYDVGCNQIDNGKLNVCQIMAYVKFFNMYFPNYAIPTDENDFLDIHKISSIEEVFEYYKKPKSFCKYCNYGHDKKSAPWDFSKRKVEEWYNC